MECNSDFTQTPPPPVFIILRARSYFCFCCHTSAHARGSETEPNQRTSDKKYLKTAEPNKHISRECRMAIRNKLTTKRNKNQNNFMYPKKNKTKIEKPPNL